MTDETGDACCLGLPGACTLGSDEVVRGGVAWARGGALRFKVVSLGGLEVHGSGEGGDRGGVLEGFDFLAGCLGSDLDLE